MKIIARWLGICILLWLSACAGLDLPSGALTEPSPTDTPIATLATVWFPPSATPTTHSVITITPTPERRPGVGQIIASDDFDNPGSWDTAASDQGSASVESNHLTLAVQPGVYISSLRHDLVLNDFYAEITASTSLCRGEDDYGLLFRANPSASYRFALSCSGLVRLDRVSAGKRIPLQSALPSGDAPQGAPGEVRLGVWVVGTEMRLFLNGHYQFTATDSNLASGTLGAFAHSAGDTPVTVVFSDLVVRSISYFSPTQSLTGTTTPLPTRTPQATP